MKKQDIEGIPINQIKAGQLELILTAANLEGNFHKKLPKYEEAPTLLSWGYEVILRRDIDEIMINIYNPEGSKAWNANMDMQVCLDYCKLITYIIDYYMKDELGRIEFIRKALETE